MILLCVDFIVSLSYNKCFQEKVCETILISFSLDDYKKTEKVMYKYFKDKCVKSRVSIKEKKERGSYLLEEIKDNGWMREKYKKDI